MPRKIRVYSKCPYCGTYFHRVRHSELKRHLLTADLQDCVRDFADLPSDEFIPTTKPLSEYGFDEAEDFYNLESEFRDQAGLPGDRLATSGSKRDDWTVETLVDAVIHSILKAEEDHQAYLNSRSGSEPARSL